MRFQRKMKENNKQENKVKPLQSQLRLLKVIENENVQITLEVVMSMCL